MRLIVIPGCTAWRRPGIPDRGYGLRVRACARPGMTKVKSAFCSRPVIAIDRDIFLGEVAGQHAVAAAAEAERDSDPDLRALHRRRDFGFVIGRIARATAGDPDA